MTSLLLVGCGKMGGAMLTRWQQSHNLPIKQFWVIEPEAQPQPDNKATWVGDLKSLPVDANPGVIVFAVKPQAMDALLPVYRKRFGDKPLYISIAAGKTLGSMMLHLGKSTQVVRAMPNTPALVGAGMTVLCATPSISSGAKEMATMLMAAIGEVAWVHKESLMDAVTAVSGSGPAYVFLFLESLTEAGMEAGLSEEMARMLAVRTVMGSCVLAEKSHDSFKDLRTQVTSPGGTTEAALNVLMEDAQFKKLVMKAVTKAAERSCELSK